MTEKMMILELELWERRLDVAFRVKDLKAALVARERIDQIHTIMWAHEKSLLTGVDEAHRQQEVFDAA